MTEPKYRPGDWLGTDDETGNVLRRLANFSWVDLQDVVILITGLVRQYEDVIYCMEFYRYNPDSVVWQFAHLVPRLYGKFQHTVKETVLDREGWHKIEIGGASDTE